MISARPTGKSRLEMLGWTAIAVATVWISVGYIYYTIFSLFQGYDDEGFILVSLKSFFQGKPLYDEIYSSFQPGFYVLHWLVFKVCPVPLCHDSIRLLTLVFWLGAATLNGLITFRLTSSALLALLVSVVSVRCLERFANEPGHPQALACMLVLAVVALLVFADSIPPRLLAASLGGLVALVLLVKINIGVFVLLPVVLIFTSRRDGKISFVIKTTAAVAMMGLPVVLWRAQLSAKDAPLLVLCLLETLGLVLVVMRGLAWRGVVPVVALAVVGCAVALLEMNSGSVSALPVFSAALLSLSACSSIMMCLAFKEDLKLRSGGWTWALCAAGFVVGSIMLFTLLRGTSFHGLADGLVWWPAKVSTSFLIRLRSNWLGACLGVAGAAACYSYLYSWGHWRDRNWFRAAIILAQVSFGVVVLAEFYLRVPGSRALMPLQDDLPHFWMLPFAWLVAVPETGAESTRFGRLSLLAIAVMQPLIACPVAGTQLLPASILLCVLGAVCLGNGLRASFALAPRTFDFQWMRFAVGAVGAAVLLAPFGMETVKLGRQYASLTPLNLPGAARIRLTPEEVRVYHQVVAELARPEVETFLTLPGLDSFYLWAQKDPPNGLNVSAWVILLDAQAQERIWQAAQSRRGLMVVRNRGLVRSWVGGRSVSELPLVRHIDENFKPVSTYGGYELMVRSSDPP